MRVKAYPQHGAMVNGLGSCHVLVSLSVNNECTSLLKALVVRRTSDLKI